MPSRALLQWRVQSGTVGTAAGTHEQGASDDVPVWASFGKVGAPARKPTPTTVLRHPASAQAVAAYLRVLEKGREEVIAAEHWAEVKEAIYLAAEAAGRPYLADERTDGTKDDVVLRVVARAVWRQDRLLARRLSLGAPLARAMLVEVDGHVVLNNPAEFEHKFVEARRGAIAAEEREAKAEGKRGKSPRRELQRLSHI